MIMMMMMMTGIVIDICMFERKRERKKEKGPLQLSNHRPLMKTHTHSSSSIASLHFIFKKWFSVLNKSLFTVYRWRDTVTCGTSTKLLGDEFLKQIHKSVHQGKVTTSWLTWLPSNHENVVLYKECNLGIGFWYVYISIRIQIKQRL